MTRRYILAYLPGDKICPWSKHREAFTARFDELFGGPSMAAYQKLADRMHCSEDTIRRLYMGQDEERHVFPRASVLAELERAMEMAPGSLGSEAVPALTEEPAPQGMPLGGELEDQPTTFPMGRFYEIALHSIQTSWALELLRNLPRNLMELNKNGKFPVFVEDNGSSIRLVSLYVLPGSTRPLSQTFHGPARASLLVRLTPIDPGKAFLVMNQTMEAFVAEAASRAGHQTDKALGDAKMEDVLASFRAGIGDLCRLNDDLKVLQVDAEDVAADSATKDPRVGFIAKRLRTVRMGISSLLRHTFPNQ